MLKKLALLILSTLIVLSFCIITEGDNYNNFNKYEQGAFVIEKLIPNRGEKNIISTPNIKICYKSTYNLENFKLFLNYKDITEKSTLTSKCISYKCNKKLKQGVQVVKLEVHLDNNKTHVTEWYFTVGSPLYTHYRGIFFNNTKDFNILKSYEDLNYFCKNEKNLDFLFITEGVNNRKRIIDNKIWNKLVDICSKYSNKDDFISIPGFELTTKLKDEKDDTKINIFNCENPFAFKDNISLESLYRKLFYYEDDLICQFVLGKNLNNVNYFKYSAHGDEVLSLLELKKENNKNKLNIDTYQEALENGWHVSPIISQYNEYPNMDFTKDFITTILCEDLTRNQILEGLINRRIYISESNNMDVFFSLNKIPMGSIVKSPSYVRIIVSSIINTDKDKIKKIEVYSNNKEIIYSKNFDSSFARVDFTLKPPKENSYYFVLITDKNNKQTLTSPIWIETKR